MYPSLSEYLYAIDIADQTLLQLQYLLPSRKQNGELYFSSGNFAVVFRMTDTRTGKPMALRCFLRETAGRRERLQTIARYIAENPSAYLLPFEYYESEIWVDTRFGQEHQFDLILMPWIEGVTLSQYVAGCCESRERQKLIKLARRFDEMALWLLRQSFAHGDIKPDNILITTDETLILIDYDGFYVPDLSVTGATETGTLPYRHPARPVEQFDRHLDDFSLLALSLELHTLSLQPALHTHAESLLLLPETISYPFKSSQWQLFRNVESVAVSGRASLLEFAVYQPPGQILPLENVFSDNTDTGTVSLRISTNRLIPWLSDNKWGFADQQKQIMIPCQWESAGTFSDGLAPVYLAGKWGFCNSDGQLTIEYRFREIREFQNGIAWVKENERCGYIDRQGNYAIKPDFDDIGPFIEGVAWFRSETSFGFIDQTGNAIIAPYFDSAGNFSEGLAKVKKNGLYGFIDVKGNQTIDCHFDFVHNFSEGLAAVEQNGLFGFINQQGDIVIPCQYENVGSFASGLVSVTMNGKTGYINKSGEICISFHFDSLMLPVAFPFTTGLALVRKGKSYGYINTIGGLVIPCQYSDGDNFSEGLAAVQVDDKWGYIDSSGKLVIAHQFEHAYRFRQELALVRIKNKLVYIDKSGYLYADHIQPNF